MDLLPSEIDLAVLDAARQVLERRCNPGAVRGAADSADGIIPLLWADAIEQGWFALTVAEDCGGAGLSVVEQILVFEELGRYLAPGPFLGTAAAAFALAGTEWGGHAVGGTPVALGIDTRGGLPLRAAGGRLTGAIPRVHHGLAGVPMICDVDGELWWVEGVDYRPRRCVDPAMRLARAELSGVPGVPTGVPTERLTIALDLFASAMAVGVADAALALALGYAKQREQFGKTIGSFQAIKHKLAESMVRVQTARCLVAMAAAQWRDLADADLVAEARLLAADHALENASTGVLVHGAIGWTVECDAHLFVLRARYLHQFRTGPDELADAVITRLAAAS